MRCSGRRNAGFTRAAQSSDDALTRALHAHGSSTGRDRESGDDVIAGVSAWRDYAGPGEHRVRFVKRLGYAVQEARASERPVLVRRVARRVVGRLRLAPIAAGMHTAETSRPPRRLSLADVVSAGRPAVYQQYDERVLFIDGRIFDASDPGLLAKISLDMTGDSRATVGLEFGWRQAVGCSCPFCSTSLTRLTASSHNPSALGL